MTVYLYPGYAPSNVSKDAKYSVRQGGAGKWTVHLTYRLDHSTRELLTTDAHPELVRMVNRVKLEITGKEGGAFYINEHCHVVVPDAQGALYAGSYAKELRFDFEGSTLGPRPPTGVQPGDEWSGPHVGIRYTLTASNDDIYYEHKLTPTRIERVHLSSEVGKPAARSLAKRLALHKGTGGGRIYVNEQCEFFAPINTGDGLPFAYLGHLADDAWFSAPELPDDA
jgi:hypothetical protein